MPSTIKTDGQKYSRRQMLTPSILTGTATASGRASEPGEHPLAGPSLLHRAGPSPTCATWPRGYLG
jgi:hypothetical protein